MRNAIIAICACVLVAACASAGNESIRNETQQTISQKLRQGMTGSEVRSKLGDPITTSYTDGGKEIWKYEFTKTQARATNFIPIVGLLASGADGTKRELTILFDEQQRVQKFNMSESAVSVNTGLLN